jgi:uncharacterized protein Yka (UPF0111/DUF47 family)
MIDKTTESLLSKHAAEISECCQLLLPFFATLSDTYFDLAEPIIERTKVAIASYKEDIIKMDKST